MLTEITNNYLVLKDYFLDSKHNENKYTHGLYGKIPQGRFKNFWSEDGTYSRDMLEFMYNNVHQPCAEYDSKLGKHMPFLDGSRANSTRVLGSLKNIWKDFEKLNNLYTMDPGQFDINLLEEMFWRYYISHYKSNFERAVQILEDYVRVRRSYMTDEELAAEQYEAPILSNSVVWTMGCRDYLRHLIYTTPRGYIMELMLFTTLRNLTGKPFREATAEDERNGIDGYIGNTPVSLKPSTYKTDYASPLDTTCFVIYLNKYFTTPDLIFEFKTGEEMLTRSNCLY